MTPSINDIKAKVCEVFGVSLEQIMSRRRSSGMAAPRMAAYYLCCEYTQHSTTEIGRAFGRDHSTVISGKRRIFVIKEKYPSEIAALVVHFHKLKNQKKLHLNYGDVGEPSTP